MRALLCHLYNKPCAINERELTMLRVAAMQLGSSELAKHCDDLVTRPVTRAWATALSRSSTPEIPTSENKAERSADEPQLRAHSRESFSREASTTWCGASNKSSSSNQLHTPQPTHHQGLSGLTLDNSHPEASPHSSGGEGSEGSKEASSAEKNLEERPTAGLLQQKKASGEATKEFTGEARALPMAERSKPRGELSWTLESRSVVSEKPQPETGSVRRVLSEIKRNIVESSRIIADKTFQQMYEMVSGERGILGEGINGPVRMARHRKSGREVAVKRISCVNLSEQRRQMLVSEVRIFLQVSHRNIVQLLEVYESEIDQAVLLVMELCTGKELFERLAERKWYSEFDAARVARQMLDAVSYLHSQNTCHRDLKLENWLYENPSQDAKLKLCDFGFGQIVEPSVQLTATLGSLFYVAPEVLEGSYGLPCDMWSIGVIVYMLLSGVPPFDGKTDHDVMAKIRQGRFVSTGKRWQGISETAQHFVRSLLRKDPYERLTAAEAAQHAWLKMECQPKLMGSHNLWPKTAADPELELPIDRGVIRDMWKFAQNNAITRAALGMLAKLNGTTSFGGREEDVLVLEQRFRSHDEQNTGKIDAESFIQVLKETLHLQISSADEKHFFERIAGNLPHTDDNSDQQQKTRRRREVNYAEFITLTKARRMANNTAAIREAFRSFDTCGDGYIKETDMHKVLGDEFKATIEKYVDITGKEFIDYLHFANIVSQEIAKKEETTEVDAKQLPANTVQSLEAGMVVPSPLVPSDHPGEPAVVIRTTSAESEVQPPSEKMSGLGEAPASETGGQTETGSVFLPDAALTRDNADHEVEKEQDTAERDVASDEELDADAASDEEQLVNVKDARTEDEKKVTSEDLTSDKEEQKAREKQTIKGTEKSKEARFQSVSLSLAGSAEYDDTPIGVNRVISMPSDKYSIKQLPGFHSRTLRPFYAARPVSNVVMGLIRGTSLYAKQSVAAKLATIIHTTCGWFFIMPNPKYHTEVDSRRGLMSKETGKFRFVAWWIHPRFVPQLRQWFERLTYEGLDQERQEQRREARMSHRGDFGQGLGDASVSELDRGDRSTGNTKGPDNGPADPGTRENRSRGNNATTKPGESSSKLIGQSEGGAEQRGAEQRFDPDMGSPGDFRFSDVPKPENYLHTYRDLHSREHVNMLNQLCEGTHRFLRSLFDENFMAHASISAGFHYPVRTQYATLHMQLRVNAGNICGEDGRGIETNTLIENLKADRHLYERDSEAIRYYVTENVKVSLLAAASEYEEQNVGESACRQISPLTYELGVTAMPTIHDEGEEDEEEMPEADDAATANGVRGPPAGTASAVAAEQTGDAPATVASPPPASTPSRTATHASAASAEDNRDSQIAANHEVADEIPASYLLNIQPTPDTPFWNFLYERRRQCSEEFGSDPTFLYPLHVSVTGFFEASEGQVQQLKALIHDMLQREIRDSGGVTVGKVICTKTGYILFDTKAVAITNFAQRLGEVSARQLGLHIRPKAVNHISLACNRPEEGIREKIKAIYEPPETEVEACQRVKDLVSSGKFDLVLSRLLARSSFERFAEEGPHKFLEVTRIPLRLEEFDDSGNGEG